MTYTPSTSMCVSAAPVRHLVQLCLLGHPLPARMMADSKRVVPSSLPDGNRHMLMGFVKSCMHIDVVSDLGAHEPGTWKIKQL